MQVERHEHKRDLQLVQGLETGTESEFHFRCSRRQIGSFELALQSSP